MIVSTAVGKIEAYAINPTLAACMCSLTEVRFNRAGAVAACCARHLAVLRASFTKFRSVVGGTGVLHATRRTSGR